MQYLVCPGSADDMIWSIVNSKLQVVGTTLDGNAAGTAAGACFCFASNTADLCVQTSSTYTGWVLTMLMSFAVSGCSCCMAGSFAVRVVSIAHRSLLVLLCRSQDHIH